MFGYPDWYDGLDPLSYVEVPWREFEAVHRNPNAMPDWEPTDQLKSHYRDIKVRKAGGERRLRELEAEQRRAAFSLVPIGGKNEAVI